MQKIYFTFFLQDGMEWVCKNIKKK